MVICFTRQRRRLQQLELFDVEEHVLGGGGERRGRRRRRHLHHQQGRRQFHELTEVDAPLRAQLTAADEEFDGVGRRAQPGGREGVGQRRRRQPAEPARPPGPRERRSVPNALTDIVTITPSRTCNNMSKEEQWNV